MEELGDNKPSTIVEIVADGDVILVVGPEEVKLRVKSWLLKAASKPFSAMFGPNWKEGHDMLGQDVPVEIPLPEDNATALKLICAVIQCRDAMVPQTLAAGDLMLLTAAAYVLKNAQAFKEITKALVLNYGGSYLSLSCGEVESAMTWRVLCLLEEQRSFAKLQLAEILIGGIYDSTALCIHKCGWTSKYAYAYLKLLKHEGRWPSKLICISEAIESAGKMPDPIPEEPSIACKYEYKHAAPQYRESRRLDLNYLTNNPGLCLHCVRLGHTGILCFNKAH